MRKTFRIKEIKEKASSGFLDTGTRITSEDIKCAADYTDNFVEKCFKGLDEEEVEKVLSERSVEADSIYNKWFDEGILDKAVTIAVLESLCQSLSEGEDIERHFPAELYRRENLIKTITMNTVNNYIETRDL